ncbi:Protein mrp homolog [Candidatus Zixiibacteriota bacterium]|nr:Protein mrp homolog [candidate division Zixibacteria bacterium]
MIDKNAVMKILSEIEDPELRRPLTELDMIKSVEIQGGRVAIDISLTIPGCPLKKKITDDVKSRVGQLPGIETVDITFGVMSEEQRRNLLGKLHGSAPSGAGTPNEKPAGTFAKRVIAVASGKGGVGKSTVTSNLAAALSKRGHKVAVLDADVYGFSIPRILGLQGTPTIIDENIVPLRKENIQVISMGFFVEEDAPVIWRGPLLHKAINQFLTDVLWDQSDFLLLDLPPGTGDVTLTIAQALPNAELLVVTTPQPVASHTAGRVAKLAEKTNLTVLGVIENMAYYENNGHREYIFGKDGGKNLAMELNVPFLGQIPIMTEIREAADCGLPAAFSDRDDIAEYYLKIADAIVRMKL